MGSQADKNGLLTFDEYMALEDTSEDRHEYNHGEIFLKTGTKANHNLTVHNLVSLLKAHFRGKNCRVFAENIKLELIFRQYYVYPDLMVTCDKDDLTQDLIMKHPTLIVEVLSKSTTVYDLNTKLDQYLKLPSLIYYLVVSQTEHKIKIYEKSDGLWNYSIVEGIENMVNLKHLNFQISLKDILRTFN